MTTNRNQKFTYNSIQKLLTNKRYIGENHFKDIVMPDSIPAIVDKDLFEEVQLKIKKNSRAPARHKAEDDYLLTTKLFCGMCGAMMFGGVAWVRNYYTEIIGTLFPQLETGTLLPCWTAGCLRNGKLSLIPQSAQSHG